MDKVRLRNALRKLRQVEFDRSDPANNFTAPLEMLEFLATAAGLKPVFLLGRGFDDPSWVAGVTSIANQMGLYSVSGPKWDAEPDDAGLPDWFVQHNRESGGRDRPVTYITKTRDVAQQLRNIGGAGRISVEEEARLLRYPSCCVREHYRRSRLVTATFYTMLHRIAAGNVEEMKRILVEDRPMTAETSEEREGLGAMEAIKVAAYTSVVMCPNCIDSPTSPANALSDEFRKLAELIDPSLAVEIGHYESHIG